MCWRGWYGVNGGREKRERHDGRGGGESGGGKARERKGQEMNTRSVCGCGGVLRDLVLRSLWKIESLKSERGKGFFLESI